MDLTLQRPGNHLHIRAVTDDGIRIGDDWYAGPLIISAGTVVAHWPAVRVEDLDETVLGPVFELQPEIVLLGTGARQVFPAAHVMMFFHARGIGVEVMATRAACRTFNVLVAEGRRVVAALMPLAGEGPLQSMQGSSP